MADPADKPYEIGFRCISFKFFANIASMFNIMEGVQELKRVEIKPEYEKN